MEASQLARLPPELRNDIYEYAFISRYAVTMRDNAIQHPITRVCRQLRSETLGLFLSVSRFNAHLNDGPTTPLAEWLQSQGPEQVLLIKEINIWDMHMLNGTLHGEAAWAALLHSHPSDDSSKSYSLQPVGSWNFTRGWYLKDIILTLNEMGLGLSRICVIESLPLPSNGDLEEVDNNISSASGTRVTLTSSFAVVRLAQRFSTPSEDNECAQPITEADLLSKQIDLSKLAKMNLTV